ncbi:MAG: geranylgeranylglycerol-phosphate geranylgeranyltransferase [Candidatus Marinimicrobia bacterium]|nr:geranylgeranylglycerol-phosphate geranylgeranyltransferase [Candidatus Neomarinimicrobiota bacterium]
MKLKLKHYFKLARPANLVLVATVVLITATFFTPFPSIWKFLLAIICPTFITAAGNALNDRCDVEIDRINKPNRPLPLGIISIEGAKGFMIAMFILGNIAGLILGFWSLFISLFIVTPLLYWYAYRLRHVALLGNIIVAFLSALTFLFAAQAFGDIKLGYVPFVFTFIISVVREIIKDLEDIDGDEAHESKTLPVMIGETPTRIIAGIIIALFFPTIPIPYVTGMYGKWFFFFGSIGVVIPMLIIMIQLFQVKRIINYHQIAVVLKIVMFIGLITIFVGRF